MFSVSEDENFIWVFFDTPMFEIFYGKMSCVYFKNFALFKRWAGRRLETFPSCWYFLLGHLADFFPYFCVSHGTAPFVEYFSIFKSIVYRYQHRIQIFVSNKQFKDHVSSMFSDIVRNGISSKYF